MTPWVKWFLSKKSIKANASAIAEIAEAVKPVILLNDSGTKNNTNPAIKGIQIIYKSSFINTPLHLHFKVVSLLMRNPDKVYTIHYLFPAVIIVSKGHPFRAAVTWIDSSKNNSGIGYGLSDARFLECGNIHIAWSPDFMPYRRV